LSENKVKHGLREKQAASASAVGGSALEKQGTSAGGGSALGEGGAGGVSAHKLAKAAFKSRPASATSMSALYVYVCMHVCIVCVCVCMYS
jgi:hypothetical protein